MISDTWVDFIAGWFSGGAAVLCIQPIDTILTRLQAGAGTTSLQAVQTAAQTASTTTTATTAALISKNVIETTGYISLWRGSSAMIGAVPMQNALLMGGYGIGKQYAIGSNADNNEDTTTTVTQPPKRSNVLFSIFIGGCTGGILQSFLMSPIELVKVNQQVIGMSFHNATKRVLTGLLSFSSSYSWRGLNATLLRDGIPHGIWFVSYDISKEILDEQTIDNTMSRDIGVPLSAGAIAATVAWAVGYPADLIKTRIQSRPNNHDITILSTTKDLIKESNGNIIRGLYRGFTLKLIRSIPASMIGFTTYEFIKKQITTTTF